MLFTSISLCYAVELPTLAIGTLSPSLVMNILSYCFFGLVRDTPATGLLSPFRVFVSITTVLPVDNYFLSIIMCCLYCLLVSFLVFSEFLQL